MKCECCNSSSCVIFATKRVQHRQLRGCWSSLRDKALTRSRFIQLQVPEQICEKNAADLEKHFIRCVRLCSKRAAELNFWQESGATVYPPKTSDYSFFLTERQFHRRQKSLWGRFGTFNRFHPRIKKGWRLKETQFWKVAIWQKRFGANYRERVHTVIKVISASLISTGLLFI